MAQSCSGRATSPLKISEKTLDNKQILCYNKDVRKRKDTSQTRKVIAMKKATLEQMLELLNGGTVDTEAIKAEISAELAKGQAKADANRAVYAEMHDVVMETIRTANAPVTAQEIADATGFSRGKVVYGLTKLWTAEVVKDSTGKANTYALA